MDWAPNGTRPRESTRTKSAGLLGACRQVVTVEFVKATMRYFQFLSRSLGVDAAGTKLRKNMANKGSAHRYLS